MFAARADQENLVYGQQQVAAAKPLNQGVKGLGAKTPGNKAPKTPFKVPLNDENRDWQTGKKGGKGGDENVFTGGKKVFGGDKNAFVTPAGTLRYWKGKLRIRVDERTGPRNRAPLGMKTTNAKGNALQTPAPNTGRDSIKTISPRLRRPKVKIHHASPEIAAQPEEEPEIEYMPPRSTPLPDHPDDFNAANFDHSLLEPSNLMKGIWREIANERDAEGLTRAQRLQKENDERAEVENEAKIRKAMETDPLTKALYEEINGPPQAKRSAAPSPEETVAKANAHGLKPKEPRIRKPLSTKGPATLTSKSAAAALSRPQPRGPIPSFAAPTASATQRANAPLSTAHTPLSRKTPTPTMPSYRHAAATAASRSTLGYSKGRAVSASARPPISEAHRAPVLKSRPAVLGPSASRPTTAASSRADVSRPATRTPHAELSEEDPELDAWIQAQTSVFGDDGEEEDLSLSGGLSSGLGRLGLEDDEEDFALKEFRLEQLED